MSTQNDLLRALPAVDRLAAEAGGPEATGAARAVVEERRAEILAGATDDPNLLDRVRARLRPSPRRVVNATGVIIHTNLGRAPLAEQAAEAVAHAARGYLDLELDLASGRRGGRDAHAARLIAELTGAQDALVVNNGAAATLLAAAALAGPGRAIVVSRGQLVEIGGGFRVPEVVAQAGARLVEVGTTNRTNIADYERALADGADVILRVHQSNFRTVGFTAEVGIEQLTALGAPVIDDLGSGVLAEDPIFADEPSVRASIAAGAALVAFSGDKLLGGPQAGILAGTRAAVAQARAHPLARALRVGRLPMAALTATLRLYRDPAHARQTIPVLAMLDVPEHVLQQRADHIAQATGGEVVTATSKVGGGALPLLELRGPAVAVGPLGAGADALAAHLRAQDPPLLVRVHEGRVLVDPRTLYDDAELGAALTALRAVLAAA
jgi:L-seryl-tRNA(Ser) seleniumtransferase